MSIATFRKAEVSTGVVVGAGSIVVAVPGQVERVPDESALLLLPIIGFVGYGAWLLWRDRTLPPADRHLVRRRTLGWAGVTIVASALPAPWVWPLFAGGVATLLYALTQAYALMQAAGRRRGEL